MFKDTNNCKPLNEKIDLIFLKKKKNRQVEPLFGVSSDLLIVLGYYNLITIVCAQYVDYFSLCFNNMSLIRRLF